MSRSRPALVWIVPLLALAGAWLASHLFERGGRSVRPGAEPAASVREAPAAELQPASGPATSERSAAEARSQAAVEAGAPAQEARLVVRAVAKEGRTALAGLHVALHAREAPWR